MENKVPRSGLVDGFGLDLLLQAVKRAASILRVRYLRTPVKERITISNPKPSFLLQKSYQSPPIEAFSISIAEPPERRTQSTATTTATLLQLEVLYPSRIRPAPSSDSNTLVGQCPCVSRSTSTPLCLQKPISLNCNCLTRLIRRASAPRALARIS
jgi:hypothetical protein